MDRWQQAKFKADMQNLLNLNPDAFDDEEEEACSYREPYMDPEKPTVTKLNYTKPTSWQILRNYVHSLFC